MEKFGQYLLLDKVGSGGMAELFKAKKLGIEGFERVLAIKRILPHLSSDDEFIDMFIAEAKLVARLSNKNIAQVYDFGKIAENYFISMEYIRGKDLRAILKKCRDKGIKFPVPLSVFIAKEVASALNYAHSQNDNMGRNLNIIHRDVSPQNILISYEGEVKVVDFGIAKAGAHSKTTTGVLKGKLSYMSPEQAWGKQIDHRSDIFSLGIVFYEMLTGERLFKGDSELNTLEMVRQAKIEPLPSKINTDLPLKLEEKLMKVLAREPDERYQSGAEMEKDMAEELFKILNTDPALSLKQFMHENYKSEIEAERKTEMSEETVSIAAFDEADKLSAERRNARRGTARPGSVKEKKSIMPYVFTVFLLGSIIGGFAFWYRGIEKTSSPEVAQPPLQSASETTKPAEGNALVNTPITENKKEKIVPTQKEEKNAKTDIASGLTINASPWANVYIDGKPYGTTPKTIADLKPGNYKLKLENPNFPPWETKVNVSKAEITKIAHKFGGFGKLIINATPWGNVYLDGNLKGQTPLTIEKVSSGKHIIKIARDGYIESSKTLEIKEGATEQLSFSLDKGGD
ncbi:MAG: protein kinase [Nitrospiraceae bacterium]|nr:protein kinase [Nitrospiraceae bacterium]